jgi:hypothetical protein
MMMCPCGTPTKEHQRPQPKTARNTVSKVLQRCGLEAISSFGSYSGWLSLLSASTARNVIIIDGMSRSACGQANDCVTECALNTQGSGQHSIARFGPRGSYAVQGFFRSNNLFIELVNSRVICFSFSILSTMYVIAERTCIAMLRQSSSLRLCKPSLSAS